MGYISKLDLSVISNKNYLRQSNISNISNISNFNALVLTFRGTYRHTNYNSVTNFGTDDDMIPHLQTYYKGNLTSFILKTTNITSGGTTDNPFQINGLCGSDDGSTLMLATSDGLYSSNDRGLNWNKKLTGKFNGIINYGSKLLTISDSGIYYDYSLTKSTSYPTGSFTSIILAPDFKTYIIGGSGTTTPGLYYSIDGGKTVSASNIITGNCNDLSIIGEKVIAFMSNGIYFSTNNGKTWTQFSGMTRFSRGCVVSDNLIVTGIEGKGYYTYNNGGTFTLQQTFGTSGVVGWGVIRNDRAHDKPYVIISGMTGSTAGLLYSEDYGKTYISSNITSGAFTDIKTFGQTLLAADSLNKFLYYSNDFGKTWNKVNGSDGTTSIASVDSHMGITDKIIIGGTYGIKYLDVSGQFSLSDDAQRAIDILYNQTSWKNEDIVNNPILSDMFLKFLGYYPSISPNILPPNINSNTPICYIGTAVYRNQIGSNSVIKWNDKVKTNYDTNGVLKLGNAPYFDFAEKYSTKPRSYIEYGGGE